MLIFLHHCHEDQAIDVVSVSVLVDHCCSMLLFVIVIVVNPSCLFRADGEESNGHGSVS